MSAAAYAAAYTREDRLTTVRTDLTEADVVAAARSLRTVLKGQYLPAIISSILYQADYLPSQHTTTSGFKLVNGESFCYLSSGALTAPVARIVAAAESQNTAQFVVGNTGLRLDAQHSWWSLRVCPEGKTELAVRRLYHYERCPLLFRNQEQVSDWETHETTVTAHEGSGAGSPAARDLARLAEGQVLTMVAQAYPNSANCCRRASLNIFWKLDFDLQTDERIWG